MRYNHINWIIVIAGNIQTRHSVFDLPVHVLLDGDTPSKMTSVIVDCVQPFPWKISTRTCSNTHNMIPFLNNKIINKSCELRFAQLEPQTKSTLRNPGITYIYCYLCSLVCKVPT